MMRAEALIAVLAGATDAQRTAILRALGHAECPSAPRINPATQSTDGLMSSADKRHLDGLAEQLRIELHNAAALIALVAGMNDAERLALWTALTGGGCTNPEETN